MDVAVKRWLLSDLTRDDRGPRTIRPRWGLAAAEALV
jgi:hypothetical protein